MSNVTNITTDINFQSADDENLLTIVNSISRKLMGIDAQTDGVNPNKTDIIDEVNDVQKLILGNYDWRFLRDVGTLSGYSVGDSATLQAFSATPDIESGLTSGLVSSVTDYIADLYTPAEDIKPSSIVFKIGALGSGAGVVSGSITGMICPDLNGVPDTANPLYSSDVEAFADPLYPPTSATSDYTLTFSEQGNDDVLLTGGKYWIVLKMAYASDNGDGMTLGTTTGSTTKYLKSGGAWTASTVQMYWSITGTEIDFLSELTLSTSVQRVYRLFTGGVGAPVLNLLPWQDDKFVRRPLDIPSQSFIVRPFAESGAIKVWINPTNAKVTTWYIEYKKKVTALSDDNDVPLIPSGYRSIIKYKALLNFLGRGYGQQDAGNLETLNTDIAVLFKGMKSEYLPAPARGFSVSRGGTTSFSAGHDVPNRTYVDLGNYPQQIVWREDI